MVGSPFALKGRRILVTRARSQSSELVSKIEQLGGAAIEFPVIRMIPVVDQKPLEQAISNIQQFHWILFTSTNGVEFFAEKLKQMGLSFSNLNAKIGAVGPKTAEVIVEWGKKADLVADDYQASGFLKALEGQIASGDSVLLPRGNMAKADLPEGLSARGIHVTEVVVYENVISSERSEEVMVKLKNEQLDVITFTSSSTVINFCKLMKQEPIPDLLARVKVACIGPVTAATAEEFGIRVDAVAKKYTIDGLIQEICYFYEQGE